MKDKTFILSTLEGLLTVLEMRKIVNIFVSRGESYDTVFTDSVYRFFANDELYAKYKDYKVIGLTVTLGVVGILIDEKKF